MKEKITVTFSSLEEAVAAHTAVLFMRDGLEEIRNEMLAKNIFGQEVSDLYQQIEFMRCAEKAICTAITGGTI